MRISRLKTNWRHRGACIGWLEPSVILNLKIHMRTDPAVSAVRTEAGSAVPTPSHNFGASLNSKARLFQLPNKQINSLILSAARQ